MVVVGGGSLRSELAMAQLVFEMAQLVQCALAAALLFLWRERGNRLDMSIQRGRWGQSNATDVEVFFETVELEKVG